MSHPAAPRHNLIETSRRQRDERRAPALLLALSLLLTMVGSTFVAAPASATPFTESLFAWSTSVSTTTNGTSLTVRAKINSNDTLGASGSQDVTAVLTTSSSVWAAVPPACLAGSALNADRTVLTCKLGKVDFGTAGQFSVNVVAQGTGGSKIEPTLQVNGGPVQKLSPVVIEVVHGIDLQSDYPVYSPSVAQPNGTGIFAVPFTISVPKGADLLTDPVTFDVTVTDRPGGVGTPASQVLDVAKSTGSFDATGEPAPCGYINPAVASFDLPAVLASQSNVDWNRFTCKMVKTGTGTFLVKFSSVLHS